MSRTDPHNAVVHWIEPHTASADGPLTGCRFAVKDVIDVAGVRTELGSDVPVFTEPAATSAEVVRRLEQAGAELVATTNCQEFSLGILGDESAHGRSTNPINAELVTGGSSMGSAIMVATGAADLAVGTDTAGSVRVPAACAGVLGFKPTLGAISTSGVFPLAQSFDTIGFFGRQVDVIETSFLAACRDPERYGALPGDGRAAPEQSPVATSGTPIEHLRPESGTQNPTRGAVHPQTPAACHLGDAQVPAIDTSLLLQGPAEVARLVASALTDLGLTSTDANVGTLTSLLDQAPPIYAVMRSFESAQVHQPLLDQYPELYQPGVRALLEAGREVTASDYDRQYRVLADLRLQALREVPDGQLLIGPALPGDVPTWQQAETDDTLDLAARTKCWNVLGWPGIVLPTPVVAASGVPVAIQVIGRPDADLAVLDLARRLVTALAGRPVVHP